MQRSRVQPSSAPLLKALRSNELRKASSFGFLQRRQLQRKLQRKSDLVGELGPGRSAAFEIFSVLAPSVSSHRPDRLPLAFSPLHSIAALFQPPDPFLGHPHRSHVGPFVNVVQGVRGCSPKAFLSVGGAPVNTGAATRIWGLKPPRGAAAFHHRAEWGESWSVHRPGRHPPFPHTDAYEAQRDGKRVDKKPATSGSLLVDRPKRASRSFAPRGGMVSHALRPNGDDPP
jgi:hypothetical protein